MTEQEVERRPEFYEFGTSGVARFGGAMRTEPLRELRGKAGRALYREMRMNDPVISAMLFAIEHALRRVRWFVQPATDKAEDRELAEFVEGCLHDMSFTWDTTLQFILNFLEQGFSLVELIYKLRQGPEPPLYISKPASSRYTDGKIGWRKWAPRPADSLADGNEWSFDATGGIQGINQLAPPDYALHFIPIKKLLLFRTTAAPYNSPEARSVLRSMYIPYYYTMNLQEVEGIGVERDLAGIPIIYLGSGTTLSGPNSDYELSKEVGKNIRRDEQECIVVPHPKLGTGARGRGMLFELLSTGGRRQFDVGAIIERYDKRKALAVLAQFVMLGMERVGSYALGAFQGDFFTMAVSAWAGNIAETISLHGIPRLLRLNGYTELREMPRLKHSAVGVPNLTELARFVNRLVAAEVLTPDEGLEGFLREISGLPKRRGVEPPTVTAGRRGPSGVEAMRHLRLAALTAANLGHEGVLDAAQVRQFVKPYLQLVQEQSPGVLRKQAGPQAGVGEVSGRLRARIDPVWRAFGLQLAEAAKQEDEERRQELIREAIEAAMVRFRRLLARQGPIAWRAATGSEPDEEATAAIEEELRRQQRYLDRFQIQLEEEVEAGLEGVPTPEERAENAADLLERRRERALSYAGMAVVLWNQARVWGRPQDELWKWDGPLDDETCVDCREEMEKLPRPLRQMTVMPALDTICGAHCRHWLVPAG